MKNIVTKIYAFILFIVGVTAYRQRKEMLKRLDPNVFLQIHQFMLSLHSFSVNDRLIAIEKWEESLVSLIQSINNNLWDVNETVVKLNNQDKDRFAAIDSSLIKLLDNPPEIKATNGHELRVPPMSKALAARILNKGHNPTDPHNILKLKPDICIKWNQFGKKLKTELVEVQEILNN